MPCEQNRPLETSPDQHEEKQTEEPCNIVHINPSDDTKHMAALRMNLSFAGCGFLGIYHLAVARTLAINGQGFLLNVQKYTGASAGALVASALAVYGPDLAVIDECISFTHDLANTVRKHTMGALTPGVSLLRPLEDFLEKLMPENAHQVANKRLFISLTDFPSRKNEIMSEFQSRQELIQYLLGSSYVPFVTGSKLVTIGDKRYLDGGMTDNLPILQGGTRTVTVSPFSGKQDISPDDSKSRPWFININKQDFQVSKGNLKRGYHAFFPPSKELMDKYFHQGELDTVKFLKKEGISVSRPQKGVASPQRQQAWVDKEQN